MFFITMTIFRIPYALTVSIIIAVFALIPVIGAFVGCFAGAIMILVENPKQAIIFLIIFIVLQQMRATLYILTWLAALWDFHPYGCLWQSCWAAT